MSAENEFSIYRPRSEKTFFPHNNEANDVWESTIEEIKEGIAKQPDLAFQYVHELWRTGRDEVIFNLFSQANENFMDCVDPTENFTKLATLSLFGDETLENCKIFLTDFYTLFCKVACGLEYDGVLKPKILNQIQDLTGEILNEISLSIDIVRNK